ncbi:MAG: flippase-like domain-containing protein, partial [Rhizobacter sp.]|nr:flippase-like domain-containing protein [Rhizobacter sp.]
AANNAMPARLGELVRADYVGRRFGVPRFAVASTIVVERAFDLAAVALCAAIGAIALLRSRSSLFWPLVTGVAIVMTVVVLVFAAMYAMRLGANGGLATRFPRFALRLEAFSAGLRSLREPRVLWSLVALSAVAWAWNALAMAAVLKSVGVMPDATVLLLVLGVSGVAAALPSAPAGIGTLQFAFVTVLEATGRSPTAGFAAALFVQIFLLGSVTLVGVILFALWNLRSSSDGDVRG